MANFNWGTGEQSQNILGNKGTKSVLGNTGTKHSLREDKKLKKKKDITGTYLATFSLHPCGCKENVELGYEYDEFTLGDWMPSKIIKKLVGRRNTAVV